MSINYRLRANLGTSDTSTTPQLHDWAVSWSDSPQQVESEWSSVEFSKQVALNTAPEVDNDGDVSVDEGDLAANTGTWSDADGDAVTLSASVGTVVDAGSGTWSWSYQTSDGPDESQTVTVTAADAGGQRQTTFELTVDNVAPTAAFGNNGPVYEDTPATVQFSNQTDPSQADTSAGFHYAYDFDPTPVFELGGDGSYNQGVLQGPGPGPRFLPG